MKIKWLLLVFIIVIGFQILFSFSWADTDAILLSVGDSKILSITDFVRVSTSTPEVVEIVVTNNHEILINAKKPGLSIVNVWGKHGLFSYRISVQEDYSSTAAEIAALIKNPNIEVTVNAKYVILNGTAESTLEADQAVQYAKMYRDNVVNNLSIKTKYQVLLTIMVTEMRKESEKKYGFRWGSWESTQNGVIFHDWQSATMENGAGFIGRYPGNWYIGSMLDAMEKNGDAKILAAPSILTLSGKEADYLVGGEIPIPVTDKVEWKEYGIKLKVTSTIEKDDTITMVVSPEVSSLDWANATILTGSKIPALTTRKVSTNVQFKDGGTLVIGGLLNRQDSTTIYKIPFLGDLPIIGPLFSSKDFQKGETELLFFVTPRIVKDGAEVDPKLITQPSSQGPYYEPNESK